MKGKIGIAIAVGALAVASASTAMAQTTFEEGRPYIQRQVRAPWMATEIGVTTGYTQGFGDLARGQRVGNVADGGYAAGLSLGLRATPLFSIGWTGQYQEFMADNNLRPGGTNVRGVVTGLEAGFHFMPYERIDPFITAGAGYRLLWTVPDGPNNNTLTHGFELGKLQAGLDVRVSPDVALGPIVGADLNMFVWNNPEGPTGDIEISNKRVNTFIYAGLLGRFDLGGWRTSARPLQTVGLR